ncbi:MAG: tRNA preQ1(34) S-adenosylmethionine ribosyltransferase-isomerase QueA [Deltaproteobacteria bacterium]|nr:tRNA preQ1(34) S-adenosylmethionine ribosyltransferase-isomerase QueA [Deltaproteobacteria bacterium]
MNINDFGFTLPEELIAQEPCEERDHSRLMVVNRDGGMIEQRLFFEIIDYLKPGDLLVINDTRVIPARLVGKKGAGGKAEIFLLERDSGGEDVWECLVGGKRIRPGVFIQFSDNLKGEVLEEVGDGRFKIRFHTDRPFEEVLEEVGQVPLPPYIRRGGDCPRFTDEAQRSRRIGTVPVIQDKERYQTVFAEKNGAVAAPTAGLHFTDALLKKIKEKGIDTAPVTLHVGPGTFLPVRVENIKEHRMLPERYEIPSASAEKINRAKAEGRRVIAVGSTSLRTLEATATSLSPLLQGEGKGGVWGVKDGKGKTSIFIYPGYTFKVVDALITNFHLPKSTLLMLVSAFAGKELISKAYREAIEKKYRFYSYGDAMIII